MIQVTVHLTYPDGLHGPEIVRFPLSPWYDVNSAAAAERMLWSLLTSGVDPIVLLDASGESWPFYVETVRRIEAVAGASPSAAV